MTAFYKKYIHSLYFSKRCYLILAAFIIAFLVAYAIPAVFIVLQVLLGVFLILILADYFLLYSGKLKLSAMRKLPLRFSNGDENSVTLLIQNSYSFPIQLSIIDELPDQFQSRNFNIKMPVNSRSEKTCTYTLKPVQRGEYVFHNINLFVNSPLQLVTRRIIEPSEETIKVYPSFLHLKKYELMSFARNNAEPGNRKIRKIGNSLEFEQIKEYVTGDDIRTINWKATARKGGLMVNHFSDERSQPVYCIIDKGRVMKMPFEGMTLLDYAINSALVISRIALARKDKAGIISFEDHASQIVVAERRAGQFNKIVETLYNQQTGFKESSYESLYSLALHAIPHRSLLILYTNFESFSGLKRQMPYIRALAKKHLLIVVFFENTEINSLLNSEVNDLESVYIKTIAERFHLEKKLIVKELRNYGIITLLTRPENLTVNTLNKYLELKARQAI